MRGIALLLLVLWKAMASWSLPPIIDGNDELIFNEYEAFNLTCRGSRSLKWKDPHKKSHNCTHDKQDGTDRPFVCSHTVELPFSLDTGYYSCYYDDVTPSRDDTVNVDSTYVYVQSEHSVFVSYPPVPVYITTGHTLVIDCATTHPDIRPSLMKGNKNIPGVMFDPRVGFEIKNVSKEDGGQYICEYEDGPLFGKMMILVNINAPPELPPPNIDKGKNQQFVKGNSFSLDCIIVDQSDIEFRWSYPNKKVEHTTISTPEIRNDTTYEKSTLVVSKASEADTGNYTCYINSSTATPNSASEYIKIEDSMAPFVNIRSGEIFNASEGGYIWWKSVVESYPADLNITYTDPSGQELYNTTRISIYYDDSQAHSWLKINNINHSDFGNYTITVTTGDGLATTSTTVLFEVKSAPYITMDPPRLPLMNKEENVTVTCSAQGFPIPDISLLFQNCSSGYTSCSSFNSIETKTKDDYPAPGNIVRNSFVFSPNASGFLLCNGINKEGSKNQTAIIRISDIDGIFVLRHGQNETSTTDIEHNKSIPVVENDKFRLLCGGNKFDYREVSLKRSPPFGSLDELQRNDSEFSWKSEINTTASKALEGIYTCTAYSHGNEPEVKSINITVLDEKKPEFEKKSNMNNQTQTVKEFEPFSLKCFVTGTPKPTIQWTKNNEPLTKKSDDKMDISEQEVNFSHVGKDHAGRYTCTAKNRLGEIKGSLTLELTGPGWSTVVKSGLTIALVGVALLVVVVVFLMNRVKKEQRIRRSFRELKRDLFEKGNTDRLNPACTADTQAEMLPYDKKNWEMPRQNITVGRQLGAGAFGRVIKASVTGLEGPATTTVAIKMSKSDVDPTQARALISELKIMMHLGKHLNIVNLMGANTEKINTGELWILVEYCRFGNLLDFMKRHRRKFRNQICPETGKIDHSLVPCSPLSPYSNVGCQPTPAVDQDGYLAPSTQKFVLSDPPPGRSNGTVPSSTTLASALENPIPQEIARQCVSNPMYAMGIGAATEDPKEESESNEDFGKPSNLPRKNSRHLSTGSSILSGSSSVNHPQKTPDTIIQQSITHSPLSPTDSQFMGEAGSDFILEVGSVPGVTAPFSTSDLICWGWQVAHGMEYLSRRKILHGDLAARNLLLADKNVVKISDFGLSRNMYRNTNYVKKGDDMLPVMWMSIEAIRDATFSIESDVWAFGITMWEIFSLGTTPYAGIRFGDEFVQKLEEGYRMSCPEYANQEIYKIMKRCWAKDPLERPPFSQLVEDLGHMVIPDLKQEYLCQNDIYVQMNEERFKEETDYLNMMASPTFESQTMPDEGETLHYVNVPNQARNSDSIGMQVSDAAALNAAGSPSPSSSNLSPEGSNYLSMDSFKMQSPSSDAISPLSSQPSRFPFSSSNPESSRLTSLPEEETESPLETEASSK